MWMNFPSFPWSQLSAFTREEKPLREWFFLWIIKLVLLGGLRRIMTLQNAGYWFQRYGTDCRVTRLPKVRTELCSQGSRATLHWAVWFIIRITLSTWAGTGRLATLAPNAASLMHQVLYTREGSETHSHIHTKGLEMAPCAKNNQGVVVFFTALPTCPPQTPGLEV